MTEVGFRGAPAERSLCRSPLPPSVFNATHFVASIEADPPIGAVHSVALFWAIMPQLILSAALWISVIVLICPLVLAQDQKILADTAKLSNESLLWGPYKPNLYFGVRPRIAKSLQVGLLWAKVDDFQSVQHSRFLFLRADSTSDLSLLPRFPTYLRAK